MWSAIGTNEVVEHWIVDTLPFGTLIKSASICKRGDYLILSCFFKLQV